MRRKPDMWRGAARIQWGCVLMQLLGESNLNALHLVLSGLRSVEQSRQVAPYRAAVRTARSILGESLTPRAVQAAVRDFNAEKNDSRSFHIDESTLDFQARSAYDPDISSAAQILMNGLPAQPTSRQFANTSKHLVAQQARGQSLPFRLNGLDFSEPDMHDLNRVPGGPITVGWPEIEALAIELDRKKGHEGGKGIPRLGGQTVRNRGSHNNRVWATEYGYLAPRWSETSGWVARIGENDSHNTALHPTRP